MQALGSGDKWLRVVLNRSGDFGFVFARDRRNLMPVAKEGLDNAEKRWREQEDL